MKFLIKSEDTGMELALSDEDIRTIISCMSGNVDTVDFDYVLRGRKNEIILELRSFLDNELMPPICFTKHELELVAEGTSKLRCNVCLNEYEDDVISKINEKITKAREESVEESNG